MILAHRGISTKYSFIIPQADPHLSGLLHALRTKLLVDLQTKARIFVPQAICLIGVMDETFTLQPGEIFVQLSDQGKSIVGPPDRMLLGCPRVLVGRSPSLHPGDLRLLKPTDIPALHHLKNVIVFSALGSRPSCDEMSGGDLDGDIYFVIWDKNLLPTSDHPPATYATPTTLPVANATDTPIAVVQGNSPTPNHPTK